MRGLLGPDGLIAAALSATSLLIAHRSRPTGLPTGLAPQEIHWCPRCNRVRAHLCHSPDFHRCLACNRYPGDDR